jgi:hypothetical protein
VAIKVPSTTTVAVAPGTNTLCTVGSCKVAVFTVSGTLTIS